MKTKEEIREKNRIRNKKWREKDRVGYNKYMTEWRTKNRAKVALYKIKERYDITPERYEEMLHIQNNRCAICGEEETAINYNTKNVQKLAVDHCHKTGKVRELLCQDCNRGIAKFKEDPIILQKAIEYIIKHQNEEVI